MRTRIAWVLLAFVVVAQTGRIATGQTFDVTSTADDGSPGTLRWAIGQANAFGGAAAINLQAGLGTINLASELPILKNPAGITIHGNGNTIDGGSTSNTTGFRVFFVGVGAGEAAVSPGLTETTNTQWSISNLTIQNANARGGSGAGGGAGLGGGVFLNAGHLTLENVAFADNRAVGGTGVGGVFTGGGGMGGNGGSALGGGGGFGIGADGGRFNNVPAVAGNFQGGASGGAASQRPGGADGGGGGSGRASSFPGGGGGVGGGPAQEFDGGNGGFGGGGGYSASRNTVAVPPIFGDGGHGGFGGGGGGSQYGNAGDGGFGGGGGSGFAPGQGGFGGGDNGGGGAGLGGAVFVRQGATINFVNGSMSGGIVQGGTGTNPGQGIGTGVFLAGGATFTVADGQSLTVSDTLGGGFDTQITGGLTKAGLGALVLTAHNSYTGGTFVNAGTLALSNNATITGGATLRPDSAITVNAGGTLRFDAPFNFGDGTTPAPDVMVNGGTVHTPLTAFATNALGNVTLNGGTMTAGGGFGQLGTYILSGNLTSTGTSAITLDAANSGELVLGPSGSTDFHVADGTLTIDAVIDDYFTASTGLVAGELRKTGDGTLVLSGQSRHTGGTTVDAGTLVLARPLNPVFANVPVLRDDTLVTVNAGAMLRFDSRDNFNGHNSTVGPDIVVNGGTVTNNGDHINALQNLTLNSGTLTGIGGAASFGAYSVRHTLTSTGTSHVNLPTTTHLALGQDGDTTFNVADGTLTIDAAIADNVDGPGALLKTGNGTLVLTGDAPNTHTGDTTIAAGTLVLSKADQAAATNFGSAMGGDLVVDIGATARYGVWSQVRDDRGITVAGTLDLNNNADSILNLNVHGGAVSTGAGFLQVRGAVAADATTTSVIDGNLLLESADGLAPRTVHVAPGGVLTVNATVQNGLNGQPTPIVKTGSGTLALTGNNTFLGGVAITENGTLAITSDAALGAAQNGVNFNSGTLRTDFASNDFSRHLVLETGSVGALDTHGNNITHTATLTGPDGGFWKLGAGTLTLAGSSYTQSNTRIDAGTLAISSDNQLGNPGGPLFMTGGTLQVTQNVASSREVIVSNDSTFRTDNKQLILGGDISGSGGVTFAGTTVLDGDHSIPSVVVTGTGSWTGGTTIRSNAIGSVVVQIGNGGTSGSLPDGPVVLDGTVYQANLHFNRSDDIAFAGTISDVGNAGAVFQRGAGTLTLATANTFHGGVRVSRGSLVVNGGTVAEGTSGTGSLGVDLGASDSSTNQAFGGTMLGGTGRIAGTVNVQLGPAGQPGNTVRGDWGLGAGTLTINNTLNLRVAHGVERSSIGVQLDVDALGNIVDQSDIHLTGLNGILSIGPTYLPFDGRSIGVTLWNDAGLVPGQSYTITLVTAEGGFHRNVEPTTSYLPSDFTLTGESGRIYTNIAAMIEGHRLMLSFTAVPEPSSLALLAAAVGLLGSWRRRRTEIATR